MRFHLTLGFKYNIAIQALLFLLFSQLSTAQVSEHGVKAKQPSLLVLPSYNLLHKLNALDTVDNQGQLIYLPRYQRAIVSSSELNYMINSIQEKFAAQNFPIRDLAQGLRSKVLKDNIEKALGVQKNVRSLLLQTVKADLYLDLNFDIVDGGLGRSISLDITVKDAYTDQVVAGFQKTGDGDIDPNLNKLILDISEQVVHNLQEKLREYYSDLRQYGRIITLDVLLSEEASFTLEDKCASLNESIQQFIEEWAYQNTENQDVSLELMEEDRMEFTSLRIPLFNDKGRPLDARNWLRGLVQDINKTCQLKVKNRTIGLGGGALLLSDLD